MELLDLRDRKAIQETPGRKGRREYREILVRKDHRDPQVWMALMEPWDHRDRKVIQATPGCKAQKATKEIPEIPGRRDLPD